MKFKKTIKYFFKLIRFFCRNVIRAAFLLAVSIILLLSVGWFSVIKYFNAQKLGETLAKALQYAFNRPVVIGSVKLVSINAVEIKDLKILDTALDSYGELLSVGSVLVRYNLMPILERRVEITEVLLKEPAISVIRDANGVLNMSDLKIAGMQKSNGTQFEMDFGADKSPLQIIIEDWSISKGTFGYRDIAKQTSYSLNGVSVRFENLKFNDFTSYDLHFILRNKSSNKIVEMEIKSGGLINLANFSPENMELKNVKVELGGFRKPLEFKADLKNFLEPKINLSVSLPAFGYDDVSLFVSKQFNFKVPAFDIKSKMDIGAGFKKIGVPSLTLSNKDVRADISGSVNFTQDGTTVDAQFKTGEFNIENADYFNFLKPYSMRGKLSAAGNFIYAKGKAAVPKITAQLNGVSAFISNFTIENVKAAYEAQDNFDTMKADISDGIFKVGRQIVKNVKGQAQYEHKKQNFYAILDNSKFNEQNIKMSVAISKVRSKKSRVVKTMIYTERFNPQEVFDTVEDFVNALSKNEAKSKKSSDESSLAWLRNFRSALPAFMPNVNGFVFADKFESPIISGDNFSAQINLKRLLPEMKGLSGTIDAKLENGAILKLQEAADRWKALGITFQPFVIMNNMERAGSFKMGQVLKDTPFEVMAVSADFDNGKMGVGNFYLDGRVIAASVGGRVDWIGEDIDLDIFTMFKNTSKRGVLSENLTDESGEPALAFKAVGSMSGPAIHIRSPKKTGSEIRAARSKGLRTDFKALQKFVKEK
ncbi:MAG: AsmA family protein [Elusimicrobiota bacterium]|jgi:hypothetical protein|nr:AsmA family protein [Elusimicrobiota bacterium]